MAKGKKNSGSKKKQFVLFGNLVLALAVAAGAFAWSRSHNSRPSIQTAAVQNTPVQSPDAPADTGDANHTALPDRTAAPQSQKENVTLSMVGDVLLHVPVSNSGRQRDGSYNYDYLFRNIKKEIQSSDAALINQEVILAGEEYGITGYPTFNGRFQVGDAIAKAGFDVVLHATNHAMDRGKDGLLTCLDHWEKHHPRTKVTGIYPNEKKASRITYVKKKGIRIAILNYTYGTNGIPLPADMPYAVNLLSENKVRADVKKAKKKADFIVVCPHWGTEYQTEPDDNQKKWSRYFLKLGVDLVIGTHPHVIQPVTWMKDKKGHRMLVFYSIGNYVNATSNRYVGVMRQFCGGMAKVTLRRNAGGDVSVQKAKMIPLITHWIQGGKITTYKLSDYSAKKAEENYLAVLDKSYSRKHLKLFFQKTIDSKFLP